MDFDNKIGTDIRKGEPTHEVYGKKKKNLEDGELDNTGYRSTTSSASGATKQEQCVVTGGQSVR